MNDNTLAINKMRGFEQEYVGEFMQNQDNRRRFSLIWVVTAFILGVVLTIAAFWNAGGKRFAELSEISRLVEYNAFTQVDTQSLHVAAAKGMMTALDDKYAQYYTKEEYDQIMQMNSASYQGIGITITTDDDQNIVVAKVIPDSAAYRAGLKEKDILTAVNEVSLVGKTTQEIIDLIRSYESSPFQLTYKREEKVETVTLQAEEIMNQRVFFRMVANDIALIRITEFYGACAEEFEDAVNQAKTKGAKYIIIDLRNNPGGDLQCVMDIADLLLDEGVLLTMRTRTEEVSVEKTTDGTITNLPLCVLMNGKSASASEVLAGALRDRLHTPLVGTKSFGKGIVQTIYHLFIGKGYVKMTTAGYYTPSGESIHKKGLEPDFTVELPKKFAKTPIDEISLFDDAQMQKAIEVVQMSIDNTGK